MATLLGDGHLSETYNLTGPEAFTVTEAAEVMSRVSGKVIRFHSDDVRTLTGHAPVSLARYIETDPDSLADVVSTTVPD